MAQDWASILFLVPHFVYDNFLAHHVNSGLRNGNSFDYQREVAGLSAVGGGHRVMQMLFNILWIRQMLPRSYCTWEWTASLCELLQLEVNCCKLQCFACQ